MEELTLRDKFAMAALNGLCSMSNESPMYRAMTIRGVTTSYYSSRDWAEMSYVFADAMLLARELPPTVFPNMEEPQDDNQQ